jgi:5-methylthioadenosine/S-adenosylhomocysteine deaminase
VTDLVVLGDVVTGRPGDDLIRDGAVAIEGSVITAVGPAGDVLAAGAAVPTMGGPGDLVTPGYVNAHQHLTADRLIRSCIPDGITSDEAIFEWAVPVHGLLGPDDDELSATLSLVEALTNGITTTVEAGTVAHPDRVAAAFQRVGARGIVSRWGWDVGDHPLAAPAAVVLERAEALVEQFPPGAGLVQAMVALVGHDLMGDELVTGASALAKRLGVGLTFHISPSTGDAASFVARTGVRPLVHLDRLGVLGSHVLLAHAVHIDDEELAIVLRSGSAVVSCPWAYLRLAQGMTVANQHRRLVAAGGRVALGCDAENASDAIDILRAATLFVGLGRDGSMDPQSLTARDGLALATLAGASAIGMDDRIGSLEPGKQADLVIHDTSGPQWRPRADDPVRQLIWASDGRSVRDVLVAGQVVVHNRTCTTVDTEALAETAQQRQAELLAKLRS